ncbi:hypothetical protein MMPV_003766 [Pyropia vietnamensis]
MLASYRRWAATVATVTTVLVAAASVVAPVSAQRRPFLFGDYLRRFDYTPIPEVSDEFNRLDLNKWRNLNPRWYVEERRNGDGAVAAENALSSRGRLRLISRRDARHEFPPNPPNMPAEPRVYGNWTTSFVESLSLVRYGYFQIHARPGTGVISSSFWLSWNTPQDWTEIDVYEATGSAVGGPGPGFPYAMFMNMHVFRREGTSFSPSTKLSQPSNYINDQPLSSRFYVYGLDWSAEEIVWFFNGRPVRSTPNVYHQQSLAVKVDSETMPNWFGLPDPSWRFQVYYVSYIRAWVRTDKEGAVGRSVGRDGSLSTVTSPTGANVPAPISPYALQRAPMPGSVEVTGLGPPVPRSGWGVFSGRGIVPRSVAYIGPVPV